MLEAISNAGIAMPAVFLTSVIRSADIPKRNKPQICMLGRSNVGKSSLINHLAGAKNLARVSAQPGLTQTINLYEFDGRYFLVDLPGYGFSRKQRSQGRGFEDMISDYLSTSERLKLVLLIIDGRHGLTESDRQVLGELVKQKKPFVIIFNKVDKLSKSAGAVSLKKLRTEFPDVPIIPHSVSGALGAIREAIDRVVRAK